MTDVECPRCDTATPPEPLGRGWWWCPVCARTFRVEVPHV